MAYLGNDLTTIVKQGKKAYVYTAADGQTVFTGADDNSLTLSCTPNTFVNAYLNGVRLIKTEDYTVSTDTFTLVQAAGLNDELVIVADIESAVFNTYTRSEVEQKIVELSPPTDLSSYSTTTQMNTAISAEVANLVDSSPTTLDTLNELAAALGDDPNFATTITNSLASKADLSGASFSGHILPSASSLYDLGSPTDSWRNIYTGDLHLSNMGHNEGNMVDGTRGNWTIQEGENDLYLINNKTQKKYKFTLEFMGDIDPDIVPGPGTIDGGQE